jgi:hypothetical protein
LATKRKTNINYIHYNRENMRFARVDVLRAYVLDRAIGAAEQSRIETGRRRKDGHGKGGAEAAPPLPSC